MPTGFGAQCGVWGRLRVWATTLAALAALAITAPPAAAEDGEQNAPAYISAIEGIARIDREGRSEVLEEGLPVVAGDRVRTEAGRVELTFADGSLVHLDRYADIDLAGDTLVRLSRGRLLATLGNGSGNAPRLVIEAPGAAVRFDQPGQYRLSVGGTEIVEVELAVIRGSAQLSNDEGAVTLNAGELASIRDGGAPSAPSWLNASSQTALERWADERVVTWRAPSTSREYLPTELVSYGSTFDQYGSWQVDATYGSVWYPRVEVDWRPYYRGRWDHVPRYGWTWIAHDPWGWPTHHYGRWHVSARGAWFWIPSRRWGPAWVYWATSPGYVGWCPLGWNGRPVINVFTSYGRPYQYRGRDPWHAWTFVPHDRFGRGHVPRTRVDRIRLDRDRPSFVMQHVPPGYAPPRSPYGRFAETAPPRRPGMSTEAPRTNRSADAYPEGWTNRNPGSAVPRGSTTPRPGMSNPPGGTTSPDDQDRSESPYERARPFMNPRNQAAPWRSPNPPNRDDRADPYVRPPEASSPRYVPRTRSDSNDDGGARDRGYAAPRRAPDTPSGMSRPPDQSGPRPGMSSPPSGHARPRGGDDGGSRGRSRDSDGGSRGSGGGGARRRG